MRSIGFDSFSNPNLSSVSFVSINFFSRDEATLYEGVSVGPSDGNQFFFVLLSYFTSFIFLSQGWDSNSEIDPESGDDMTTSQNPPSKADDLSLHSSMRASIDGPSLSAAGASAGAICFVQQGPNSQDRPLNGCSQLGEGESSSESDSSSLSEKMPSKVPRVSRRSISLFLIFIAV